MWLYALGCELAINKSRHKFSSCLGVTEVFRHEVPLLLSHTVLFPGSKLSLTILEEREIRMLEDILSGDRMVGVVFAQIPPKGNPTHPFSEVGTLARVLHADLSPEQNLTVILRGEQRFRLIEVLQSEPYWLGRVEILPNRFSSVSPQLTRLANRLSALLYRYIELREIADQLALADMTLPTDLASLGFRIGALLDVPAPEKQALLESEDLNELLLQELAILNREIKRLQHSAFWNQFIRRKAVRRALPLERAIWN